MQYALIFLALFLASCCSKTLDPEDTRYAHRQLMEVPSDDLTWAVEQVAAELKYERRLRLENAMVCRSIDSPMLRLEFTTQNIMELCEARELLVDVVERFLYRLNTDYIDPEFRPAPYTSDNLEIYINFESYYTMYADRFYIGWVCLEDGEAYYYASTLKNNKLAFWHKHQEPYFKSKSIARAHTEAEKVYKRTHQPPASALRGELYRGTVEEKRRVPLPFNP